jgi:hypothetical protein
MKLSSFVQKRAQLRTERYRVELSWWASSYYLGRRRPDGPTRKTLCDLRAHRLVGDLHSASHLSDLDAAEGQMEGKPSENPRRPPPPPRPPYIKYMGATPTSSHRLLSDRWSMCFPS